MPFDSTHTPKSGGLAAQASASARPRRDVSPGAEGTVDPRIVTRGSFSHNSLKTNAKTRRAPASDPALADLLDEMFFDWFQVTAANKDGKAVCEVGGDEEIVAIDRCFDWCASQGLHPGRVSGGHNGYRAALPWTMDPESLEVVVRVNSGSTSGVMPNIMLTGGHGACADLAPSLQSAFPDARLSRADVALDWSQEGLWDQLLEMARTLSKGNKKLGGVRTIESDTGRTFYLGSRTSTVSLRVYEKDLERAARGVIDLADVDPNLIRIEWTFRPQSKSKAGMMGKSPGEMVRTSPWARNFMVRAAAIMHVTDGRQKIYAEDVVRETPEKTLESTVRHGVDQYAKSFLRLAAAKIVERDHDGHYDTAVVEPEQLENEANEIFSDLIRETGAAVKVIGEQRLDRALDPQAWRSSYVHEMQNEAVFVSEGLARHQRRMADRIELAGTGVSRSKKEARL